jgi:hypothetical protein
MTERTNLPRGCARAASGDRDISILSTCRFSGHSGERPETERNDASRASPIAWMARFLLDATLTRARDDAARADGAAAPRADAGGQASRGKGIVSASPKRSIRISIGTLAMVLVARTSWRGPRRCSPPGPRSSACSPRSLRPAARSRSPSSPPRSGRSRRRRSPASSARTSSRSRACACRCRILRSRASARRREGETGTGKEVLAESRHGKGPLANPARAARRRGSLHRAARRD